MRIVFVLFLLVTRTYAQSSLEEIEKNFQGSKEIQNLSNKTIQISLQDAIESGLRENINEKTRKYTFQLNEITFKDAFDGFWYPNLNLTMATTSDHFVENFYRDVNDNTSSSKTPGGYIGLEIEDYTLFNWGRDYLEYLNAKETYRRAQANLSESKRELRLNIIQDYFNLAKQKEAVKIYKKQLSHASFIYRLAKEKLTLKKVKTQEFLEAKSLFLGAHKDYHQGLYVYDQLQQTLTTRLGENFDTPYRPINTLKYRPLSVTPQESLDFALKTARRLLDARAQMSISNRSFEKAQKDNLPLPTFSVKLGTYRRNFTGGVYSDDYETFTNSKNIEVAASLNMTWNLTGPGGLMNKRIQENAYYNKKISEVTLRDAHRQVQYLNRISHSKIDRLEKLFKAAMASRKNAREVFDQTIDNYISGKTNITNVRQILNELKQASIDYEISKYDHLSEKIVLAKLMGVSDFPGEKFERLVEE